MLPNTDEEAIISCTSRFVTSVCLSVLLRGQNRTPAGTRLMITFKAQADTDKQIVEYLFDYIAFVVTVNNA